VNYFQNNGNSTASAFVAVSSEIPKTASPVANLFNTPIPDTVLSTALALDVKTITSIRKGVVGRLAQIDCTRGGPEDGPGN
jgi:hypothetical protein